jgi:diguanylate cyclase (GGDEF)-like protein
MTDNLTMLYSHRHLHDTAAAQAEQAAVQDKPFAAVVVRLDGLGEKNERDGYAAGDDTIQAVARAAQREASRAGGTACRMSGRRIAVVLPDASEERGWEIARAVSAQLDDAACKTSAGAAAWQPGDSGAAVLARAEAALRTGAAATPTTPV